ncbi:MAG TPA: hypothetical protein VGL28_02865 [Steroidobacteraceae bacterium]|jgi:hypothetical protein
MAIIKCSECGRAVSDKAAACIGCGAPIVSPSAAPPGFNIAPERTPVRPLTSAQLRWRLGLSSATLVLGVIAADAASRWRPGSHLAATLSALLLICGLCWFIVAIIQNVQARR